MPRPPDRARTTRARRRARSRPRPGRDPRPAPARETAAAPAERSHALRLGFLADVVAQVLTVEGDRPGQAFGERDRWRPARDALELRRIGIKAPDIDRLLVRRPLHV